jgi:hypothetical protein
MLCQCMLAAGVGDCLHQLRTVWKPPELRVTSPCGVICSRAQNVSGIMKLSCLWKMESACSM